MGLITYITMLAVIFLPISSAYANWLGPQEIVSGTWGSNPGQFAIKYGDTGDGFPRAFCVSSTGVIAIADEFNSRVQTFKSDGSRIAFFGPQSIAEAEGWRLGWPLRSGCLSNGVYTEFDKYTQIFGNDGALLVSRDSLQGGLVEILSNDNFISRTSTAYYLYSPTGQLIRTSTTRPLELGIVNERPISESQYRITIKYPDKTYELTSDATFMRYVRDNAGNINAVTPGGVWRFNQCGKEIGEFIMPRTGKEFVPTNNPKLPQLALKVEYGNPIVAPNGDVYTWKKTDLKYSILKWTWVDDPNVPSGPDAPTGLSVAPSINGLYLTWTASPQDPGCVTGYEIARATSSGGVFSTVATVEKGVVKYNDTSATAGTTYYYKVRAKAGTEYSPYTAEASGKR